MRIAFLCKRRYMGKDVIDDRYARLYEIPFQLARLGHEVHGFCLGYQSQPEGVMEHDALPGRLVWHARSLHRDKVPRLLGYPWWLRDRLRQLRPHLLIGASDIPHVALAGWLAGRLGVPYAVDLYDNFEGFGQARIPGFKTALRHAARQAGLVTTTSDALRDLVRDDYRAKGEVISLPSTVDLSVFASGDRRAAREALGLPIDAPLVGTAGGLYADKGIGVLYDAWPRIAQAVPGARLVLAGPTDPSRPPPEGPQVHYLGMLAHARAATLFQALDVGVIYLRDTPFGRYCFPQKAYEMLSCGLAVAAADVGAMPSLLAEIRQARYRPDDPVDLARAVVAQLRRPQLPTVSIESWETIIARLEPLIRSLAAQKPV
ncbi:MAG: group 1 glycosyl transferase [Rhodanobacter sp. SCN 68-63]|nr:MAG: group 1 glycosyl transferase [Rhodanobacter sp. SCN 68-63]